MIMFRKIIVVILLSLFAVSASAQKDRDDGLTDKDIAPLKEFTVNVITAEFVCTSPTQISFRISFDQSRKEIERVGSIFPLKEKTEDTNGQTAAESQNGSGKGSTAPVAENDKKLNGFYKRFLETETYYLFELGTGKPVNLLIAEPSKAENTEQAKAENAGQEINEFLNYVEFPVDSETLPQLDKKYSVVMRGLKFEKGASAENPSLTSVKFAPGCESIPANFKPVAKIEDLSPPAIYNYAIDNFKPNKSAPEVKVSFAVNGENPTKPIYETVVSAKPFETKRLGIRGAYSVVPLFFNLERNNTPENEIDKMSFGTTFKHLFSFDSDGLYSAPNEKTSRFIGIKSELSPKVETTTKFKKVNIILGYRSGLPINAFQVRSHSLRVSPFVGFDLGYTLKDEAATTKEKWILRPNFGFEFYYTPFRNEKDVPFLIESTFITRAFLKPEVISTRDAARKVIVEGASTNPKVYFYTQVTFLSTKFISPFVRYSWGRDAPQFLLEDHKYRAGIQANFDWGKK